jgi:hypothetical protein
MAVQNAEFEGLLSFIARPEPEYLVARKTVSGFAGAKIVVTGTSHYYTRDLVGFMSTVQPVTIVHIVPSDMADYNADLVASILAADADEPDASFDNVVDLLDWLNRD